MTATEAAAYLGVSRFLWYTKICKHIAGHRIGEKLKYRVEDLDAYAESRRVEPVKPAT